MTQSSAALEISDEESKGSCFDGNEKTDKGKENVDPNEMLVSTGPVTRSAAAAVAAIEAPTEKDNKIEEPRTPLGDLNASEFYAEGLDATSVVLVHEDCHEDTTPATTEESQSTEKAEMPAVLAPVANEFTFSAPIEHTHQVDLTNEPIPQWAQQASHTIELQEQQNQDDAFIYCDATADPENVEPLEIWESESAKDENENENENAYPREEARGCVVVEAGERISLSSSRSSGRGMYLQEI